MNVTCVFVILACVIAPTFTAEWSYHGETGPDNWGGDCDGNSQSPINIVKKDARFDPDLEEDFAFTGWDVDTVGLSAGNNGHTVYVAVDGDVTVNGGGLPKGWDFKLLQFHFHWANVDDEGSEHTVDGKYYPLEVHFVTYRTMYHNISMAIDQTEGLAVLGFFFEIQAEDNDALIPIIDVLQDVEHKDTVNEPVESVRLDSLLGPDLEKFWRYSGSLTTPGCFESVTWTVFQHPIGISATQLAAFRGLKETTNGTVVDNDTDDEYIGLNYRPIQDLNGRNVKTSVEPEPVTCPKPTGGATRSVSFVLTALLPVFIIGLLKL